MFFQYGWFSWKRIEVIKNVYFIKNKNVCWFKIGRTLCVKGIWHSSGCFQFLGCAFKILKVKHSIAYQSDNVNGGISLSILGICGNKKSYCWRIFNRSDEDFGYWFSLRVGSTAPLQWFDEMFSALARR